MIPTPTPARPRRRDRGLALVLVLSVMSVLLLAGAIATSVILSGLRVSAQDTATKRALFCAEAGLAAGRAFFGANYPQWSAYLACNLSGGCTGYPLVGYADTAGAGRLRYEVRILDNIDEAGAPDPRHDNDLTVFIEARCADPDLPPRVLQQLVSLNPSAAGSPYRQAGGWNGTNHL
jgi:hypothetical protein